MSESKIYGIDLGTTYCCVARINESGQAEVIRNSLNEATTPAAVYFESPENIIVGRVAKESGNMSPERLAVFVKREMGNPDWYFPDPDDPGKKHNSSEVSAFTLAHLVKDANEIINDKITKVVITCPAYFGTVEKEAVKAAGKIAGLEVVSILEEPVAAAISYGVHQEGTKTILVYDLGGGTFDVTVIAVTPDKIQVVCTDGDHRLGGKDWDDQIVKYFVEEFSREYPEADIEADESSMYNLQIEAEKAKQDLSHLQKVKKRIQHDNKSVHVELTRDKFTELTRDKLESTINFTREVINKARAKGFNVIDEVVLVGGSTFMPQVPEALQAELGQEPKRHDPNQAVALGAALYGNQLMSRLNIIAELIDGGLNKDEAEAVADGRLDIDSTSLPDEAKAELKPQLLLGGAGGRTVSNVTSKTYGLFCSVREREGGQIVEKISNVLMHNTTVPCRIVTTDGFATLVANQTGVDIRVAEGNSDEVLVPPDQGEEIGQGQITGLPSNLPAGTPIGVIFDLDDHGLLTVDAECQGQKVRVEIQLVGVMTEAEIETAKAQHTGIAITAG